MLLLQEKGSRKIGVIEEKNVEVEEIEEGKNEILNGKSVLFKSEEFLKQLKVERK
tara:strand:+ start:382 stop:546 length:165 start_codon:yes stop_codon:yes gene_type:complete